MQLSKRHSRCLQFALLGAAVFAAAAIDAGAQSQSQQSYAQAQSQDQGPVSTWQTGVERALSGKSKYAPALWDRARWRDSLRPLYAARAFEPLWISGGKLTASAAGLLEELGKVQERGLIPADYWGEQLVARAKSVLAARAPQKAEVGELDATLSIVAARLASDLQHGRVEPRDLGYDLDLGRPPVAAADVVVALSSSAEVRAALDAMEPSLRHYALLKKSLAHYRQLALTPQLTALPALPRYGMRLGARYEDAAALRRLLLAVGDLPAPSDYGAVANLDDPVFDAPLVAAVAKFQSRHGLDVDGVVGRATYRALTTSFVDRIRQIELSLERMRWLPRLQRPPIIVNIPQFKLFAFRTTRDDARDILSMDVIVGATFDGRETPVFAAEMTYLVFQPYWDVPASIAQKELLPLIRRNPDWGKQNGYELVAGQGDDAKPLMLTADNLREFGERSLRLRQKPGEQNALGHVKFMFPNRHNVYLHDTPAPELFSEARRAFSHGCIRVSDPMTLVSHVLRGTPDWSNERLEEALKSPTPLRMPLPQPIPVFIVYGTALSTEAGQTLFFDDIYTQDARLARKLVARRTGAAR